MQKCCLHHAVRLTAWRDGMCVLNRSGSDVYFNITGNMDGPVRIALVRSSETSGFVGGLA